MATTAVALAMAGCCPPPDPQYAECGCGNAPAAQTIAARTPAPAVPHHAASTRAMPAPVMSRFQQPGPNDPRPQSPVERRMITEPPVALPGPKLEETPRRETLAEPKPPAPTDTLPDVVIMKLLEGSRAAFVRCFKKAINEDPTELSFKVKVHVVLDNDGAITSATTDTSNRHLDACLTRMTAWIKFPASGKPIAVDLPLFYRGE